MKKILLAATDQGLVVAERDDRRWNEIRRGSNEMGFTSVIGREGVILAGTRQGVYRSDDLGETWQSASQGLPVRYIRWLAYHPQISDFEFAGTEPAGIAVSRDGAQTWRDCPEIAEWRKQFGWYLPYSPEAGCVRGFAFHGQRVYAAVEVGGVLFSNDAGENWQLAKGSPDMQPEEAGVHADVHSIEVHPSSPDLVDAATGGGYYRSLDGGAAWTRLYRSYCRAVWVNPLDAEHILLGPAESVDRNGRIVLSHDGGKTWQPASTGLDIPWPRSMVERFVQVEDELMAVLSNGELYAASLDEMGWQPVLAEIPGIRAVAGMHL